MGALATGSRGALQRAGALFPAASTEPMEPENMASPAPAPAPPVGGALPNGALDVNPFELSDEKTLKMIADFFLTWSRI